MRAARELSLVPVVGRFPLHITSVFSKCSEISRRCFFIPNCTLYVVTATAATSYTLFVCVCAVFFLCLCLFLLFNRLTDRPSIQLLIQQSKCTQRSYDHFGCNRMESNRNGSEEHIINKCIINAWKLFTLCVYTIHACIFIAMDTVEHKNNSQ